MIFHDFQENIFPMLLQHRLKQGAWRRERHDETVIGLTTRNLSESMYILDAMMSGFWSEGGGGEKPNILVCRLWNHPTRIPIHRIPHVRVMDTDRMPGLKPKLSQVCAIMYFYSYSTRIPPYPPQHLRVLWCGRIVSGCTPPGRNCLPRNRAPPFFIEDREDER